MVSVVHIIFLSILVLLFPLQFFCYFFAAVRPPDNAFVNIPSRCISLTYFVVGWSLIDRMLMLLQKML